ncbi:MAG: DNA primase [Pseudomonadota bacterium]
MALPPGILDDLRNRLSISDIAARKVIWDQRKSNPTKGDFWAPCPFHQEKTASFHVDDRKGFYYCFGCHAKGDMINFVKETDNVSFIEAVEILCREAGVEMPQQTRDPHAAEKRDRAQRLADVMEQAVQTFGLAFRAAAGQGVRDYAAARGLTAETLKRFEIGFAPESRSHLTGMYREKGVLEEAIAAGMVIQPDDGGQPYDRFRNRLMFPIRDPRGRCIGFGGRAMDPNARAKYLNSPATELFDKSRVLFNYGPAREAAGKTGRLIVAEGYMDVIALAQGGFDHAVAPNGTAITEHQLAMMWKLADEPVIALDGDKAGLRAVERLADLALPLLTPGKSLRFCLMPQGQDPDDLIKAQGSSAMQAVLDSARPLIDMIWDREVAEAPLDTPERKAALDQRLRALLNRIQDPGIRNHYGADFKARRAQLFAPASGATAQQSVGRTSNNAQFPGGRQRTRGARGPAKPVRETVNSGLARSNGGGMDDTRIREATILLILLRNPDVLEQVEDQLENTPFLVPDTAAIRDGILSAGVDGAELDANVMHRLGEPARTVLERIPQARAHPLARAGCDPATVAVVLSEALVRHQAMICLDTEIREARRDASASEDRSAVPGIRAAHKDLVAANARATADSASTADGPPSSDLQRMLDDGTWRRDKRGVLPHSAENKQ